MFDFKGEIAIGAPDSVSFMAVAYYPVDGGYLA
ncbi:hypothetical protein NX02_09165 [Sphingomonas sanxanigenens DSM 19645 = NX02]|uniref:Uncharacterized protein n=1 Tax=Sphingomonas sanxanigenens DSM 19645 = NX02 TaxID=1123269 RepID=W0A6J5_9SPHN|nr:hypothetical protein NX02_09165 [Sphingomonas sanxanigenens DSM 19645 = NX02]